jgi:hypothetical protein
MRRARWQVGVTLDVVLAERLPAIRFRRRAARREDVRKEEKGGERRSKHSRLGVEEPVRRSVRPVLEQNERADEEGFSIPGDAHL